MAAGRVLARARESLKMLSIDTPLLVRIVPCDGAHYDLHVMFQLCTVEKIHCKNVFSEIKFCSLMQLHKIFNNENFAIYITFVYDVQYM